MNKPVASKLFKLKQWLTLPETVRHLTGICGEEVTEADIFRFALEGHLTLSINIVNDTPARLGQLFYEDLTNDSHNANITIPTDLQWDLISSDPNGICYIKLDDEYVSSPINGIWDLPLMFDDRLVIQRKYHELIGGPPISREGMGRLVLKGNDELVCQLQEFRETPDRYDDENFFPAEELPKDSFFVVTIDALRRFEQVLNDSQDDSCSKTHTDKSNGHLERHAQNREQILGAAFAVLTKWPEECRNSNGEPVATKIANLIEAKANLFWTDSKPPLTFDVIAEHLRDWIKKANSRK